MTKTLFVLDVSFRGKGTALHFDSYGDLLTARGSILSLGIDALEVADDNEIRTVLIIPAEEAADHVSLWTRSFGDPMATHAPAMEAAPRVAPVVAPPEPARVVTPESGTFWDDELLPSGLTHKEEVLHMLRRDKGVTLDQIVERYGINRDSASALISTTCSKYGYTSNRSPEGVYTAIFGRADGRGVNPKTRRTGRSRTAKSRSAANGSALPKAAAPTAKAQAPEGPPRGGPVVSH